LNDKGICGGDAQETIQAKIFEKDQQANRQESSQIAAGPRRQGHRGKETREEEQARREENQKQRWQNSEESRQKNNEEDSKENDEENDEQDRGKKGYRETREESGEEARSCAG
jgi:hypothetical protein